jgi:hypothetical protein
MTGPTMAESALLLTVHGYASSSFKYDMHINEGGLTLATFGPDYWTGRKALTLDAIGSCTDNWKLLPVEESVWARPFVLSQQHFRTM